MDHRKEKTSGDVRTRFGKKIRTLRTERQMTQMDVATATGISREHLSRLESGRKEAGLKTIQALARTFRLDISELMRGL